MMADLVDRLTAALGDRYRIERELGRGGMGVVLLAHDLKHDRPVAIKAVRPELAESLTVDRFLREIRIAAQLQHPNILALIDSGEADGITYFVMPFVPGESLRQRLDREGQLSMDDALQIAREVADALGYAHEHGVVHRDIKPENILLGAGHALVTDFGIARAVSAADDKLTATGMAVGTPAYMSPEQGSAGTVDSRTDVYSLGCVLYEMLAGTPPYTGTFQVVLSRKAVDPVPSIKAVRDTVPELVERVVMKALAKIPADRFATAQQFAAALSGDTRALGPPHGASRRRWMLAGAAAAVVFIVGMYTLIAGVPWRGGGSGLLRTQHDQLTSESGVEWFPSLSPDGKWMVYSGQQSGNRDIYLRGIGGTAQTAYNLTKDSQANDDQPAFSPDGERIAFRSERDSGGIFVMGRTGEGVRRVTRQGFHPTWSPDGTQLAFSTENVEMNPFNGEGRGEVWLVNADGTSPRRLVAEDGILPSWSPHGHRIVYTRRSFGAIGQAGLWSIAPGDTQAVPLLTDRARNWSSTWSPDGRYVYYASDHDGSMNLWRIAVDEASGRPRGEPEPVTTPATFLAHPSMGHDGRHLAYVSSQTSINVQRIAIDSASGTVAGNPVPVTTGLRQWSTPDPSPDGRWVAFYTLTQPEGQIYVSRPDGTELRRITPDSAVDRMPRWSPDGQWISFFSTRAGSIDIWKIRPDGSGLQRLSRFGSPYPVWSPDGKHIVGPFQTPGRVDVVVLDANRGAEDQRPDTLPRSDLGDVFVNAWSPDGEWLTGQIGNVGAAGKGVFAYSFRTKRYEKISDFGEWPVWLPDSRRVLFVANKNAFYIADVRTKQVRKILSVERDVIGAPRLTRDGRSAYFTRRINEADIWMLTFRSSP